jgi:hypothetical protein
MSLKLNGRKVRSDLFDKFDDVGGHDAFCEVLADDSDAKELVSAE